MSMTQPKQPGFTIVELLVVIVVIAILAAITIVSYTNVQTKARDSARKSDVASITKVVSLFTLQTGNKLIDSSANCGRQGAGFWHSAYDGNPSLYTCMKEAGISSGIPERDPDGGRYMKAVCTKNGRQVSYILASLKGEPQNPTFMEGLCDSIAASGAWGAVLNWDVDYGMNYAVQVP